MAVKEDITAWDDVTKAEQWLDGRSAEVLKEVEKCFVDLKVAYGEGDLVCNPWGISCGSFKDLMNDREHREQIISKCGFEDVKDLMPIERICWFYGQSGIHVEHEKFTGYIDIDCDACRSADLVPEGVVDMYLALWQDTIKSSETSEKISADTMNSFFTLYKNVINANTNEKIRSKNGLAKSKKRSNAAGINAIFDLFAYLTHTAGNFMPCYSGFNPGRYYPTMDFWDLTLMSIREWFLDQDERQEFGPTAKATPLNEGLLDKCAPWLNSFLEKGSGFEHWKAFVQKNFLEPYVENTDKDIAKDPNAWSVRPFFDGHSFENKFPRTEREIYKCLDRINASIIVRNNLIRKELADKSPENDEEKAWIEGAQRLLFLTK